MWAVIPDGQNRMWCFDGYTMKQNQESGAGDAGASRKQSAGPTPAKYPGIDYTYAPASYWSDADPLAAILRNVKGENRRKMIRDYWENGQLEELDPSLLSDVLDEDARKRLGRIHPSFMGGEYLPNALHGEVEIARICLQSATSDVISFRARPVDGGIAYRVVDEYEEKFVLPIEASERPLTLAEMVRQFDEGGIRNSGWPGGGLALGYNLLNAEYTDFEDLRNFTHISSPFYPQLEVHFEAVFDDWVRVSCEERDSASREEGGGR
jgi:hypothetical protein